MKYLYISYIYIYIYLFNDYTIYETIYINIFSCMKNILLQALKKQCVFYLYINLYNVCNVLIYFIV
jgi:hypothetical protein